MTSPVRLLGALGIVLLLGAPSVLAHGSILGPDEAAPPVLSYDGEGQLATARNSPTIQTDGSGRPIEVRATPPTPDELAVLDALAPTLAPFESVNQVLGVAGTPWTSFYNSAAAEDIAISCPSADSGTTINDNANTFTIRATCPYRIIDDADLLGSAQIAVSPLDPNEVAFFSLHGAGTEEGPTPRSRDPSPEGTAIVTGLSHTTFTSNDMGRQWFDNPWGQEGYGEHVSGVMDRDGNMYIAALWSKPIAAGAFDYLFKLYKADTVRTEVSANYQYDEYVQNRAPGNTIEEVNLVYLPAPAPEVEWNGSSNSTRPADPSEVGNATQPGQDPDSKNDRVVAVWFERALDWQNSTTGKSSWIDAAWSDTRTDNNWTRLADKELIGPCMYASNPVAYKGKAYVACTVDAGYDERVRARIGQIDVWSIDPMTGETELMDYTNIVGGRPRMASRPDGYMALGAVALKSETNVDVSIGFGWYGRNWSPPHSVGPALHDYMNHPAIEARITAMAMVQEQNTVFLSYMERTNTSAIREPDPNRPPTANEMSEYRKLITSVNECDGILEGVDLNVGVSRHPFQEGTVNGATGVFDDLQDGMTTVTFPDDSQQIFFAYGDHGVIQYGWIFGDSGGDDCAVVQPAEAVPPPAIPAAQTLTNAYTTMLGAGVGLTAVAMVGYLLTAKRASVNKLAVKDK